jgi:DNA-binding SARP family transcriptional activator
MIDTTTLLEVTTLGRFEVRRNNIPLSGGYWSRRKVNDLFKLLLSAEQHRLHREQIQDILWPDSTSEQAANSFGKTLYLLRRALEPDLVAGKGSASIYVLLERDTLMLIPESMGIDADFFESSVQPLQAKMRSRSPHEREVESDQQLLNEFDHILSLYKGDYLPDDLYEDWAQRRRDRLRRLYSWLLENAARLALVNTQRQRGQRAVEYLQALIERNSADEQTHRQLMLVYARMGRRSDALNQFQLLRTALRDELDAEPLPETVELHRRIQAGQITVDLWESQQIDDVSLTAGRETEEIVSSQDSTADRAEQAPTNGREEGAHTVSSYSAMANGSDVDALQGAINRAPTVIDKVETEAKAAAGEQDQVNPERILKAELVGREEEILTVQRAYQQTRKGQRKAVFVCGEPGIGKTRLAREFTEWSEETQQATVLWGYCYEMSGSFPYQPIADAISAYVRMCNPAELREILGNSAVDLAKIAPEVRFKLPELPQPEPIGPEMERRNLYSAVAHFINALAEQRPLIIILDDLQWADAATMQLLNFLLMQSTGFGSFDSTRDAGKRGAVPLYLMLYRADAVHDTHPLRELMGTLARSGISEDVRLQRLSESEVHQLLVNIAGHSVGPIFSGEIFRQSEGNPFFIGEAIRTLILEGKIKKIGDRWQATVDINQLELPHSVRLLIERRLAHLSPECRTTMTLAAVLGRQFSSALLCQARNLNEDAVAEHIDDAIQAQILSIFSDSSKSGTQEQDLDLSFTHDKIREVLYQWLNPLRRRTLHSQVATAIETRYAAHLQPYYSTLAYHYHAAENPTRAVDYMLQAAAQAASVYAFVNAAEHIKAALDLLISDDERPRRAELLRQLSEIYIYTGRPDKAIEAGMASAALWRELGNYVRQAEAYLHTSFCCHWQGKEIDAVEHIQRALKCIENRPEETALLARAYAQWGLAATVMGEPVLARAKLQQADALHEKVGGNDAFISVVSLWSLSWCAFLTESPQQMLEYALRGAEVCSSSNKPEWEPMMNYSAAWACMLLAQLDEGQRLAHDALIKAQQHGVVGAQGWANLVQALLAIQAGQWQEAEKHGDSAYAIATMLHDADMQARVLWSRSVCDGWRDDWQDAVADSKEAIEMAQKDGETSMVFPHLLVQAAKSHLYAGKIEEAQQYLDQAMQYAQSRHYRQLPAIGQRLQGRIWQAQKRFEEAQRCFERSLAELETLDDQVEYARTQEAYGLFFQERGQTGDEERGKELLESAREIFQRLGVKG